MAGDISTQPKQRRQVMPVSCLCILLCLWKFFTGIELPNITKVSKVLVIVSGTFVRMILELGGGWRHKYSTKTRLAGHRLPMYSLMSMEIFYWYRITQYNQG